MKIRKLDDISCVSLSNCLLVLDNEEYDFLKKRATEHHEDYGKSHTLNECIEMEIGIVIKKYYEREKKENYILE